MKCSAIVEACHAHTILAKTLKIEIGGDALGARGEALGLGEMLAILVDQALAVPSKIGGGFAEARRSVDISGNAFGRLARAEHAPVLCLADGDVAGRQVHEHKRASERGVAARRERRPQVLANLDMHSEVRPILGREDQVAAKRNLLACHLDGGHARLAA